MSVPNKYGAKRVWACSSCLTQADKPERGRKTCGSCRKGIIEKFDSKMEFKRFSELFLLQKAKVIRNLTIHPAFKIVINDKDVGIRYEADFQYFDGDDNVVEDVKGVQTPVFRLKRKLVEALYPGIKIRIVR